MPTTVDWGAEGVKIVRAASIRGAMRGPPRTGRATAFEFSGTGGRRTWIGAVALGPGARTEAHHHGRHEVAVYVLRGHGEIRWGERLEFAAEIDPGDFVYFAPYVPHRETNLADTPLDFLVVRSDSEAIAVKLDVAAVEHPLRLES